MKKLSLEVSKLSQTKLSNLSLATENMLQYLNEQIKMLEVMERIVKATDSNIQQLLAEKKMERDNWISFSQEMRKRI